MGNLLEKYYFLKSFYCMGRPHKECFGCSYCRARGKYEEKEYLTPSSEINPLFNTIPVVINIFYGDPFLYMEDTLECLKRLESSNHRGPVVIITKGPMSDDMFSKIFTKKWKLNIHFGLSFFGNRKYDEAATFERLEENLSVCKSISEMNGYTYGIEYRPIIRDINDSPETMDRLFTLAKKYSTTVAYSGLQVDATLSEYIRENNLPFRPYDGYDFGMKKNIGNDILWNLKCHSMQYNVPIFKKTSCAISYSQKTGRDYNAHYYRPNEMDCASCPNKDVCHSFKNEIDNGNIDYELISKLPFDLKVVHKEHHSCKLHKKGLCKFPSPDCLDINGIMLQTDTELTTSDVRVIKWITGMTVDAVFKESPYISDDWIKK
jgi:hypothetical protein